MKEIKTTIKLKNIDRIDTEFVPEAERFANSVVPDYRMYTKGRDDWSRVFIDRMNELTIAAGLRVNMEDLL